ncbi:MAG: VWA domain-containing protein [Rhodococcus sp. (in: high G+C Gram-positive bacteria)]
MRSQKGVVGRVVERMAAVAAQLDDDGEMQAFTFASNSTRLPDLRIDELPEWTALHVRVGQTRLLGRAPKGQAGQIDMRTIGIQNEDQKVIAQVRQYVRSTPVSSPTLVLFFADGGVYRNNEIEKELRGSVREPIFWQFVGLGSAKFGVLETLRHHEGPAGRQLRILCRTRHRQVSGRRVL